jgi:hypothetical protein
MQAISYRGAPVPIRDDFAAAHNRYWERLAKPGAWFSGAERVAMAGEIRQAWDCRLCARRKEALSPAHVTGAHDSTGRLPDVVVEVIHRVVTDPGRLTRAWFDGVLAQGLSEAQYVEIIGTIVAVFSIDEFCRVVGIDLNPLPEPEAGEATRYRPASAARGDAWVSMIPADENTGAEADLWGGGRVGNVIRAMSLVPDEVRTLNDLGAAHYVAHHRFLEFGASPGGALSREQMEVIAARVSALNGCFY